MMVVSTTGHIISSLGPYFSDGKNNDANILIHDLKTNAEDLSNWLREGDIVVVDRGFRDSVEFLNDLGIKTEMPVFLKRGQKQHTVEESNSSRL
jgi:3-deoxy-D-arabino-heptulosonate 7-phosphate (DAHP) synthase